MVIYLRHPVHGTKVACSDNEAIYDEENGWVRYNLDTPREAMPVNNLAPSRSDIMKASWAKRKEIQNGDHNSG
jgi:hypothetical protein